jgi:hypothetical protein
MFEKFKLMIIMIKKIMWARSELRHITRFDKREKSSVGATSQFE